MADLVSSVGFSSACYTKVLGSRVVDLLLVVLVRITLDLVGALYRREPQ